MKDKHVIWSCDIQFDELTQSLCDIEAVQLFYNKINKIHQIDDDEQIDEKFDDKISDEYSDQSSSSS